MIIVKFKGGLGNQMFQYAFGRALSIKYQVPLLFDLTSFEKKIPGETRRNFELNPLGLDFRKVRSKENTSTWIQRILNKFSFRSRPIVISENSIVNELRLKPSDSVILDGYFQNEKYFSGQEDMIRSDFLRNRKIVKESEDIQKKITGSESVALHVRRGDYVTNPNANKFHCVLPVSYYKEAISAMRKVYSSPEFFFFSDDIEWCKEHFRDLANVNFISFDPERSPVNDLWLMSLASNFIIGNSTFSWWAAWIGEKDTTKIIAPKNWFRQPDLTFELPERWIQM